MPFHVFCVVHYNIVYVYVFVCVCVCGGRQLGLVLGLVVIVNEYLNN